MSGEDVYDVARAVWCDLCEAPHLPCEPNPAAEEPLECVVCGKELTEVDEDRDGLFCPAHA